MNHIPVRKKAAEWIEFLLATAEALEGWRRTSLEGMEVDGLYDDEVRTLQEIADLLEKNTIRAYQLAACKTMEVRWLVPGDHRPELELFIEWSNDAWQRLRNIEDREKKKRETAR